jgi:hypothetical protein
MVAARECFEETGGQLSAAGRTAIEQSAKLVAWHSRSKFALFVHEAGAEDLHIVERVTAIGAPPDLTHDPDLKGMAWEPLTNLLDAQWCRREMHEFSEQQVRAVRPVLAKLHAAWAGASSVEPPASSSDEIAQMTAQLASVVVSDAPTTEAFDRCAWCAYNGIGSADMSDGLFYCFACWAEYRQVRLPVLGAKSPRADRTDANDHLRRGAEALALCHAAPRACGLRRRRQAAL